jgi:hypothetical protein
VAEDTEEEEVFDEEDLADGFDAELIDGEELADGDDVAGVDGDIDEADDLVEVDEEDVVPGAEVVVADDEDDLALDHDVELALDEVLAETMRLTTEPDDDDDAAPEVEDKSELTESVLPKQDDEFRCHSCRLLKKVSQMADEERSLCRDCV